MKKVFLALMAVAAIAFTGCNKDPKLSQEEKDMALVTAAKDALDTDGNALVDFLTKNGYTCMGDNVFKNGNEYCSIANTGEGLVSGIDIYTMISPSNFEANKSYFLRMETACATVFPTGFEGEYDLGEEIGAFDKELEFRNYAAQVTEGQFTKTWNRLRGRSDINDNSIRELVFEYSLAAEKWICDLYIWKPEI